MIQGIKCILRPLNMSDYPKTLLWRNNLDIKNSALMHPFPISNELEKSWYEENVMNSKDNLIVFGIELCDSKELVGFIKLHKINWVHNHSYFGIVIGDDSARGKGLGKESSELLIDYAFNTLNIRKILLEVVDYNKNAIKMYESLGFIVEGVLKEQVKIDKILYDVLIMSLFSKQD